MKWVIAALGILILMQTTTAQAGFFDFFKKKETNATESLAPDNLKPRFGGVIMSGRDLADDMQDLQGSFAAVDPLLSLTKMLSPTPSGANAQANAAAAITGGAAKTSTTAAQSANPFVSFLNVLTKLSSSANSSSWSSVSQGLTDTLLDQLITEVSFQALDGYFSELLGKSDVLSAVEVEVPDTSKLDVVTARRVQHIAALLVAMKAANRIVAAGNQDEAIARSRYKDVMALREQAAGMLADGFLPRTDGQASPATALVPRAGDKPLLDQFANAKRADFVKDDRVQELALALWKARDPAAYARYDQAFAAMRTHYHSFSRSIVGTASMLGFSALYIKRVESMVKKEGKGSVVLLTPLLEQGVSEMLSLAPRMLHIGNSGTSDDYGSFALETDGHVNEKDASAEKIFGALDATSKAAFQALWISGDQQGLLASLDAASPESAAEIADRLIQPETKKILAKEFAPKQGAYSFVRNELGKVGSPRQYRTITDALFTRNLPPPDKNCVGNTRDEALRLAQRDLRNGVAKLKNRDLRRLALAQNPRPGGPIRPLVLGKSVIRVDKLGIGGMVDRQTMREARLRPKSVTPPPPQKRPAHRRPPHHKKRRHG